MDDASYNDLKIRMVVMPEGERWHEQPRVHHWLKLEECRSETLDRVSKACKALDEVDQNPDLSPEGRIKAKRQIAEKAVRGFRESPALERARSSVASQLKKWGEKIDAAIVPAADHGMAMVHNQIRDRISSMDEKARLAFIDKNIDNAVIVSAVLLAPPFVSGLSDVEINVIRQKLSARTLTPEIAEQIDLVKKASSAAERGWMRAATFIEEKAGLRSPKVRAA